MPVEFRGYAKFDGEQFFSLKCMQGRGSAWVRLGQNFYEGQLVGYDPKENYLLFARAERTFKIKMFQPQESYSLISYHKKLDDLDSINSNHSQTPVRLSRVGTSLTREEKIAAGRVGYTK